MASSSSAKYEPVAGAAIEETNKLSASSASTSSPRSARLTPDSEDVDHAPYDAPLPRTYDDRDDVELEELPPSGSRVGGASRRGLREVEPRGHASGSTRDKEDEDDFSDDEDDDLSLLDDEQGFSGGGSGRARRSSIASFELCTPDEERAVRWKLDTRLVLFVAMLYMMSFLDRSNIGNAKIAGLVTDLHLSDSQFSWLLSAFYITYILFEWMTLCYRIFPPHIYIACCVLAWGVLASLQSLATSFTYLVVIRTLLGIGEAAFVGMPIFLSFFFRREELALRVGLFISAAPLAEAFASSLAYAIVSLGNRTSIASWRLLFLVEGFPACIVSIWTWYWVPDSPSTARWLTTRERWIATQRMRNENPTTAAATSKPDHPAVPRHKQKFQWSLVLATLRDPKAYLTALMFFSCNVAFSSMPVFLPSIVHSLGYSATASQALSAPPFLCAFLVVILTADISDRYQTRSWPMIFHACLACSGYIFAAVAPALGLGPVWRYLAVYPICAGFFSAVTVVITWTVNNQASDEGKGTGMAVLNVFGQMGPLIGTRLYPDADAPGYLKGNVVCAVAMACVGLLAFGLRRVLARENARRIARRRAGDGEERTAFVGVGKKGVGDEEFLYMI